jgi:hypothetical protein
LPFFILTADANRDRHVNALDFNILANNYGRTVGAALGTADFNYDHIVGTTDFDLLATRYNTYLAPPSGPSPAVASAPASLFANTPIGEKDSVLS